MAIIYSYPQVKPKTTDLLVGTVVYQSDEANPVDGNPTRTFSLKDVGELLSSYKLSSKAAGSNATIILSDDFNHISAVNLIRGTGISVTDNGSNGITIGNTGVLSVTGANTTFINSTPALSSSGNVVVSSSLSASGGAGNKTYLRGDNTWSTPVLTLNTVNTSYIDLSPTSSSNGDVIVSASLSASGTPSATNYLRGDNTWSTPLNSIEATNTTYIATTLSTSEAGGVSFSSALSATGEPSASTFLRGDNVWAVPDGGSGTLNSIVAGDGIKVDNTDPANPVVINDAPDKTVLIEGSGNAIVTGEYPNFNINVPEGEEGVITKDSFISTGTQTQYQLSVTPTSATYTEVFISGVYQEASTYTLSGDIITLSTAPDIEDTVEIVTFSLGSSGGGGGAGAIDSISAGDGISIVNTDPANPIINNEKPDLEVVLDAGSNITITGDYPNFEISAADAPPQSVTSVNTKTGAVVLNTDDISDIDRTNKWDKPVSIEGFGSTTVTGEYPNFNISSPTVNTNDFITNANDVYPSVAKVTNIISLTQAEYDTITPDDNTIYIIIG
jgi:hypothetical protein